MDFPGMHGLSRRALSFVRSHGHRLPSQTAQQSAERWIQQGIDQHMVDRVVEYDQRWAKLYLPPSIGYNGGPKYLGSEMPVGGWAANGYIEAGPARFSVSYEFLIDDSGLFGLGEVEFVPLYKSVEGWIESLAVEYALRRVATETRRFNGSDLASLDLSGMTPFPGIPGLADSWLIGNEAVVHICRGVALLSNYTDDQFAMWYSGIADRDAYLDIGVEYRSHK